MSDLPQVARADARIDAELYRSAYAADQRAALAGILAVWFADWALEHRGAPAAVRIWAVAYVVLALLRLLLKPLREGVWLRHVSSSLNR